MKRPRKLQKTGGSPLLTEARCALNNGHLGPTLIRVQQDELRASRQFGGVDDMKKRSSVYRISLAAIAATAMCLFVSSGVARAQNAPIAGGSSPISPGASAAQPPMLTSSVGEVVKMYQGGIGKDLIVDYINSTPQTYRLNADGIIYLKTLGMPQEITKAMILRDGQTQQQQANQKFYQPQPMPGSMPSPYGNMPAQPPVQVMTPSTPAPDVSVVGSDYADYGYGYPYDYGYPYYYGGYYGWPWVGGGGWGWGRGWGYGGYRGGYGGFRGGGFGGFHGGVGGFHGGGGLHGGGVGGGFHGGGGGGFHGGGGGGGHGGGGHR
jgi:hypothetical protein